MDINDEIKSLIDNLSQEFQIPTYVYNNNKKFIPGVTPVLYSGPYFDDKEIIAAIRSLLIGKWMSAGESVKEFEHAFSRKTNQSFSVMVNSGSSANLIMFASLKKVYSWEDGSEIIISAVGFPTSYSTIIQNNLVPKFIDIEFDTLNFDLDLIESEITDKTVGILLSPVLGNPPDMDVLVSICEKHNLKLILDNCDSLGSKWNDKQLTEYAVASSCSFYAAHTICTFEGGMVSSNNRKVINTAKSLITWGRSCVCSGVENLLPNGICNHRFDTWIEGYDGIVDHKYVFENIGYNLKPLDMQGAIGLIQLNKLDEIFEKRFNSFARISNDIFYVTDLRLPDILEKSNPVWFGVPLIAPSKESKQKWVAHFEKNRIQTRNYFCGNILLHKAYKHLGNYKKFPNANRVLDEVFFIGCAPFYTEEYFKYIRKIIEDFR
jgi:CDP-4-dehydro-6-deoxyglucose reductase, E1